MVGNFKQGSRNKMSEKSIEKSVEIAMPDSIEAEESRIKFNVSLCCLVWLILVVLLLVLIMLQVETKSPTLRAFFTVN